MADAARSIGLHAETVRVALKREGVEIRKRRRR
jgi:hypothetical protein